MTNLPTLRVLAAVLCIDLDDPNSPPDLEAVGLLLARRALRKMSDEPLLELLCLRRCGDEHDRSGGTDEEPRRGR